MIKLQPGYHCDDCPCFNGDRYRCNIIDEDEYDQWLDQRGDDDS